MLGTNYFNFQKVFKCQPPFADSFEDIIAYFTNHFRLVFVTVSYLVYPLFISWKFLIVSSDPILEIIEPQNIDEIFMGHTIILALGKTS